MDGVLIYDVNAQAICHDIPGQIDGEKDPHWKSEPEEEFSKVLLGKNYQACKDEKLISSPVLSRYFRDAGNSIISKAF